MAGSARYTAVLDANVLYPNLLRDLLLSLAHADLYSAKWTVRIEDEWMAAKLRDRPDMKQKIEVSAATMRLAIPDCLIAGFEPLVEGLTLPDPNDRHVLAAAIVGHADAIVSANARDFPAEVLARYDVELQSPDEFVVNQINLQKLRALGAIKRMRERWERPQMGPAEMIDLFEKRGLALTAAHLRDAVDLI